MDSIKNAIGRKEDKDAQPGDQVESRADNKVNSGVDQAAGDFGVPQQDDRAINDIADKKVNDDIPGGN